MPLKLKPVTDGFTAVASGVDLTKGITAETAAETAVTAGDGTIPAAATVYGLGSA